MIKRNSDILEANVDSTTELSMKLVAKHAENTRLRERNLVMQRTIDNQREDIETMQRQLKRIKK